jgi:hypothetical protein
MGLFYQDRILYELYKFARQCGVMPSELLLILHERRATFTDGLRDLYQSFNAATRDELWDSREALEAFVRSNPTIIDEYVAGERGNNVLFRHRAIALLRLVDDIHDAAFAVAREVLTERAPEVMARDGAYLDELKEFSLLRKRNLFPLTDTYTRHFRYNLQQQYETDFERLPVRLDEPEPVVFHHADEQREMLASQYAQYGTGINAIGRIISRIAMSKLQRAVRFGATESHEAYTYTPGFRISPSEFA